MNRFFLIVIFFTNLLYSQVGINTATPARTLDVEGNLKVRKLEDKSKNSNYNRLAVVDRSGNVDHVNFENLQPTPSKFTSDKVSYNDVYSSASGTGIPDKHLKCGKFEFRITDASTSNVQFRLAEAPAATVNIYMTMEQNFIYEGIPNGFQFYQGTDSSANSGSYEFTTANYSTFRGFPESELVNYEQNIMHFLYPADKSFYRVTVYKVRQDLNDTASTETTGTNIFSDFVLSCEKF